MENSGKKNHHLRNIEFLKSLKEKNSAKLQQMQEEQEKLEETRQRLAKIVLRRAEQARKLCEERPVPAPPAEEKQIDKRLSVEENQIEKKAPEEDIRKRQMKAFYESRYHTLLAAMQEKNREKAEKKKKEEEMHSRIQIKLKENLGFANVSSKLLQPTVASMAAKQEENNESKPANLSQKAIELPEETNDEESRIRRRQASEFIKRKATENLAAIAQKKEQHIRKEEEAKEKEFKNRAALRETILLRAKTCEKRERPRPISALPPKPKKNVDEKYIEKLAEPAKKNSIPVMTDMQAFKRKHKLTEKDKVFIIKGGFPDIARALKKRGWYENTEKESPCFDFIWTLHFKDVDYSALQDQQLCNHFENSSAITTKIGLMTCLSNLVWFNTVDIDTFFPRAFELKNESDIETFATEFKFIQAECILKRILKGESFPSSMVQIALSVCERRLLDLNDLIDQRVSDTFVTSDEWQVLSQHLLTESQLKLKKYMKINPKKKKNRPKTSQTGISEHLKKRTETVLQRIHEKYPQTKLNGNNNVWIVKPAGLSRGRGIACYNNLPEVMDHISKEGTWIIQKYIENPLLILKKKFDIRQWVLVTSWNPLTIYFYEKCYIRFGVEDFSFHNISDVYAHLTNNSIVKTSENFHMEESMWTSEELAEWLREQFGENKWDDSVKPGMKQIVRWSLECAQDMVHNRKNSFELYGYDFMIDEDCRPWLIEINKSPALDYSTPVTKKLVKSVMEDTVKVIVDCKDKTKADYGDFSLLFKAKRAAERLIQSMGLNLMCEGKAIWS